VTDNHIDPVDLPDGTIAITPKPGKLGFMYQHINGEDVISIVSDDDRVGNTQLMLTPSAAQYVAMNLWAMVADLENLRQQWRHR
jgi:hypothetical protein